MDHPQSEPVRLHSLEHDVWQRLQSNLVQALQRHALAHLTAPSTLILHDLIDAAVSAMHHRVFRQIVESDFGLNRDGADGYPEELYKTETDEHGSENIARFCKNNGWQVSVSFPDHGDELIQVDAPVAWDSAACSTARLIDALGYRLDAKPLLGKPEGQRLILMRQADRKPVARTSDLLDDDAQAASLTGIFEQLGYGLIHFASNGEIVSVSPSMLARLRLDVPATAIELLEAVVPLNFYNDIIWGVALSDHHGVFENYRIRVKLPSCDNGSILFNVSGFRDEHAIVHSLWQAVSLDEGGSLLSEGSMLSEVRIHNITRNYVPQLVEEKARDAIRLGKNKLTNEVRNVAVLFCDIVGFTSYVEANASSESIIDTLNSILRRVASCVKRNRGSIDKFMGDCVMALFDRPADALLAACDMQGHAEDINTLRLRAGQQTLQLRIGVHWGEVVIGNVGTVERLDWTAIGDVVNTASRIEKGCHPGAILISEAIRDAVPPSHCQRFTFGDIFRLQVKGKWEELAVCHVTLAAQQPDTSRPS
jgi:adenylate cyclase